jgi:hypothetical protein
MTATSRMVRELSVFWLSRQRQPAGSCDRLGSFCPFDTRSPGSPTCVSKKEDEHGYPENRDELIDAIRTEAKQRGDTHLPAVLNFTGNLHDDDAAELAVFCDGFVEGQDSGGRECLLDYWKTLRSTSITLSRSIKLRPRWLETSR